MLITKNQLNQSMYANTQHSDSAYLIESNKNASRLYDRRRFFMLGMIKELSFPAFQQYAGIHAAETKTV